MLTIRRLYLYVMAGIMLAVLAAGLRLLVTVLLDALGVAGDPALGGGNTREELSLAGALVGVGLPVWAIHWSLIRRALRGPDAEAERASGIRAAYLSVVLAASLAFVTTAAVDLVRLFLQGILDLHPQLSVGVDAPGSLATVLVAGAVWGSHALVRRGDMAADPLEGGAVLWPRLYLYGVQLVSLVVATSAFSTLVNALADRLTGGANAGFDDGLAYGIPGSLAAVLVAGLVFLVHAGHALRLVAEAGWRGESERASRMRVGYLAVLVAAGLAVTLGGLGDALRAVLFTILDGAANGLDPATQPGGLPRAIAIPLITLVPWLGAALHARYQLLGEARRSVEAGRRAAGVRLDRHIRSLVGVGFGGVAIAWLMGIALDTLVGGDRYALDGDARTRDLASFLPNAVLGLALWAESWGRLTARRAADPAAEAASGIRRAALLTTLGVGLAASVGSGAFILYRAFGSALGVAGGPGVASELAAAFGVLFVAGAVALYHGLLVREDARTRSAATQPEATGAAAHAAMAAGPTKVEAPAPPADGVVERRLVLRAGSPAELDAALLAARTALPPGATLADG